MYNTKYENICSMGGVTIQQIIKHGGGNSIYVFGSVDYLTMIQIVPDGIRVILKIITFIGIDNNIKIIVCAVFFSDHCAKHILQYPDHRRTVDVLSFRIQNQVALLQGRVSPIPV